MKEWDSGLMVVMNPKIEVSPNLLAVCNSIQDKFPRKEFSVLAKGHATKTGFYVTDDYIIPEQVVAGASVNYGPLEAYQADGYNVVIHSHHEMGTFFSGTDIKYINTHFPCSVLYTKGAFTIATMSFHVGAATYLFEVNDVMLKSQVVAEIPGVENIKEHVPKPVEKVVKPDNDIQEVLVQRDCFQCSYQGSPDCLHCYEEEDDQEMTLCWAELRKECIKCGYCDVKNEVQE